MISICKTFSVLATIVEQSSLHRAGSLCSSSSVTMDILLLCSTFLVSLESFPGNEDLTEMLDNATLDQLETYLLRGEL